MSIMDTIESAFRASRIRELVDQQAKDPALWFKPHTAPEGYLQRALRTLHAAIEGEDVTWLGD